MVMLLVLNQHPEKTADHGIRRVACERPVCRHCSSLGNLMSLHSRQEAIEIWIRSNGDRLTDHRNDLCSGRRGFAGVLEMGGLPNHLSHVVLLELGSSEKCHEAPRLSSAASIACPISAISCLYSLRVQMTIARPSAM